MALVQPVTTEQVQAKIDEFAIIFFDLEQRAQLLVAFRANMAAASPRLLDDDGTTMEEDVRGELYTRLGALQTFVNWANAGSPSPLAYLRGVKRAV